MYFSRVRIENEDVTEIRLLRAIQGDMYAAHQLIWKLFPNRPSGNRGFLFRQEFEKEQLRFSDLRRGMPIFYLISNDKPTPLAGLLAVDSKEYSPKLTAGDQLFFSLRLNPVVGRKVKGKKNSVKHDVLMDAKHQAKKSQIDNPAKIEQLQQKAVFDWLTFEKRSERLGFSLNENSNIEVTSYRQNRLRKRGQEDIEFSSVDISGNLTVANPEVFLRESLYKGIGHSKSFGCGMMMVRRV